MRQQRFPCVRCGKRLTVNQVTFHAIRCQYARQRAQRGDTMLICIACRFAIIDHTAHLKVCGELLPAHGVRRWRKSVTM